MLLLLHVQVCRDGVELHPYLLVKMGSHHSQAIESLRGLLCLALSFQLLSNCNAKTNSKWPFTENDGFVHCSFSGLRESGAGTPSLKTWFQRICFGLSWILDGADPRWVEPSRITPFCWAFQGMSSLEGSFHREGFVEALFNTEGNGFYPSGCCVLVLHKWHWFYKPYLTSRMPQHMVSRTAAILSHLTLPSSCLAAVVDFVEYTKTLAFI